METTKTKKPFTLRLSQLFIGVTVALMAACLIFCLIYFLLGISPAEIPLAPGISRTANDTGGIFFHVKVGALRGTFALDEVTLGMAKTAMYTWLFRVEALLFTFLLIFICLSRMMESIRVSGYIGTYAARQLALCGLTVIFGSTLCSLADAFGASVVTRTYFADILASGSASANAVAALNFTIPVGAWIGGLLLLLASSLCMRYIKHPLPLGAPKTTGTEA